MAEVEPARSLAECERVIERGFVEAGNAFIEIRDAHLYKEGYGTFEDYCEQRWRISRSRAYQLIEATETTQALSTNGGQSLLPTSERQARELTGLPTEKAAEVMSEAAATGKVTAASIREARERVVPQPARHLQPVTSEPAPAPRRRPLTEGFRDASLDLTKLVARLSNLVNDERYPKNRNEVARYAGDLIRARDALQRVIDHMSQEKGTQ